jgi:hypothetical protein
MRNFLARSLKLNIRSRLMFTLFHQNIRRERNAEITSVSVFSLRQRTRHEIGTFTNLIIPTEEDEDEDSLPTVEIEIYAFCEESSRFAIGLLIKT